MTTPILTVERLTFDYGRGAVPLTDISFALNSGAAVGIFGPNGSGKSSLLSLLGGHLRPAAGRISVDGIDVTDVPAHLRPTATVFQDLGLFPHLSCRGNITVAAKQKGRKVHAKYHEFMTDIISSLGLEDVAARYPRELSGGMRQRCAIGRGIACAPKILMMDEPTASLDVDARISLGRLLRRIQRDSKVGAMIIVSHDVLFLMEICPRLIILDAGRLIADGPAESLYNQPESVRVARLLGIENVVETQQLGIPYVQTPFTGFRTSDAIASVEANYENPDDALTLRGRCVDRYFSPPHHAVSVEVMRDVRVEAKWSDGSLPPIDADLVVHVPRGRLRCISN